jgi:hypothetical protein
VGERYGHGGKGYLTADVLTVVAVGVVALCGTNVVHLVDGAALGAALDRAVARHGQPSNDVRVGRAAGATDVLLVTERANDNGLLHGACSEHKKSISWRGHGGVMYGVVILRTRSACVEGLHVEDVDALHLSEDFETLETGGLVDVGGDGTGLGTSGHKVMLVYDL